MNPHTTLLTRAATVLAAGGFAWLTKMAVITATDGAENGASSAAASVFYLVGVALMCLGLAGIGFALAARRHLAVRIIAGVGGLLAFFPLYVIVDSIAKAVVGDAGPTWLEDEAGILATGTILMTAGLLTVRAARTAPTVKTVAA